MKKKEHVALSKTDHTYLEELIGKGSLPNKKYRRAIALLDLNRGYTLTQVAQTVNVTIQTVSSWAKKYRQDGLSFLDDKARSGRPKTILSVDEAAITALACTDPPQGYGEWTLRLLAERGVELIEADSISYSSVRRILKKTTSSPT